MSSNSYVIVTTTYPTTYGGNRGRNWCRAEMICRSDVDVSDEKYKTYNEAVKEARTTRDNNDWFDDYEEILGDSDGKDLPPFDSAEMENYDNDEEILIRVMKESEIAEEREKDHRFLERAREKKALESALKSEMIKLQVIDRGGKVFYSRFYPDSQIPAQFEFDESKNEGFVLPTTPSSIKSIMFKVTDKMSGKALRSYDEPEHGEGNLMKLLTACTSLEELYLLSSGFQTCIDKEFFDAAITKASHLRQTLKVLSVSHLMLAPSALAVLGKSFPNLTRLDISDCFSTEYYQEPDYDYEMEGGLGCPRLPYDDPLIECLGDLTHLERLDLGNGDPESRRYLHDYALGPNLIHDAKGFARLVTMDRDNMPEPFLNRSQEKAAKQQALQQIVKNEASKYTEGIVELAKKELKLNVSGMGGEPKSKRIAL